MNIGSGVWMSPAKDMSLGKQSGYLGLSVTKSGIFEYR